jgi:RHS repeat-associated protein
VNGDGLPDLVRSSSNGTHTGDGNDVYINTGKGWSLDANWTLPAAFKFGYVDDGFKYTEAGVAEMDVDGDNMIDFVRSGPMTGSPYAQQQAVYSHNGKVPDLLSSIEYPEGGAITATYKQSALYADGGVRANYRLSSNLNTVNTVEYDDQVTAPFTHTYSYGGGENYFASSADTEFAGFATTTVTDERGNTTTTYIHQGNGSQSAIGEYADAYEKIGKPYLTEVRDSGGSLYSRAIYAWDSRLLATSSSYVFNAREVAQQYDGDSDHKDSATEYAYSPTGDLLVKTEWGEVTASTTNGLFIDTGSDKRVTAIQYASSTSPYRTGFPSQKTVTNQASSTVGQSKYYYDGLSLGSVGAGNRTKEEDWISGSIYATNTWAYNAYGLVTQAVNPLNATTTYAYDGNNLYPATTTNALGQATAYVYDYSSGKPKQTRDINGYLHTVAFDGLDRVLSETNPDPSSGAATTTQAFAYTDTRNSASVVSQKYLSSATTTASYQYFDGFGRKIQQRDQAEDAGTYVVRDWVYGGDGLLSQESLPYFGAGSGGANATSTDELFISYDYDALNRRTSIENAVGTTENGYDQWKQAVTDPLGRVKGYLYDAFGNLASVEERNATSTYTTSYDWDAGGNLVKITDALGNIRNFTYDGLGRRVKAEDLHAPADGSFGSTTYAYDSAGNLVQKIDPKNQAVNYAYDALNRPLAEDYAGQAGTEIAYAYDACANGKGLLCFATSTGAVTAYSYAPNGLMASETEKIDGTPYATGYAYDLAGNRLEITYPDGSVVRYSYNAAGLPETVEQKEAGGAYAPVIIDTDYAPTGLLSYQEGANGVYTRNTYAQNELYRLKRKQVGRTDAQAGSEGLEMMMGGMEQLATGGFEADLLAGEASMQSAQKGISASVSTSTSGMQGKEIPAKSTWNSRTFLAGETIDGKAVQHARIFTGPIAGADTLVDAAVETGKSYVIKSGGVEIGLKKRETSDLVTFSANGTSLRITPQAAVSKISSPLVSTSTNARRYENLFGAGADLELTPQDGGLRKDIVLSALPDGVDGAHDYTASFLMTADAAIDIRSSGSLLSEAGTIVTKGGVEILSGGRAIAYIWPPEARDSGDPLASGHSLAISLAFKKTKQGILITKQVPGAWLAQAAYPVRADFVLSVYAGAGDGAAYTGPYPSSWQVQHADTTGSSANHTDSITWAFSQAYMSSTGYLGIGRVFLPFDTSGIPDTATIDSATLYVYPQDKRDDFNDAYAYLNVYQGFQASPASVSSSDVDDCGDAVTNPTSGSSNADITGIATTTYLPFALNSTALGWISKTGYTKLCLREGHDSTDNEPVNNAGVWLYSGIGIYTSEASGASHDPYLDIAYTMPSAQSSSTLLEVDGAVNPAGLTDPRPKFSSVYTDPDVLDTGVSYQIQVSTSSASWASPFWDSGKQDFASAVERGSRSQLIGYTGSTALAASTTYYWRMKFWDASGVEGAWSTTTASFSITDPVDTLMDNVYGYDAVGNITSIADIKDPDNPSAQVFAYDDLDRLVSMGTTTASVSYSDTDRVIQPDGAEGKDTYYGTVYVTGGAPNGDIARIGGWADDYYSYFEFPLDNLPDSGDISSARLYLYNENVNNYNEAKLLRITSPWTESGVTSASNPSSSDYGMAWQAVPDNDWWDADVTQLVKDWNDGVYDNYGVKVAGRYDNGDLVKAFTTSDSSNAAHRPKLVITGLNDVSGVPDITLGATTTPAYAYAYDAVGNMLSATGQGSYAYAGTGYANPHAATSVGGVAHSYDNNGNLTGAGGAAYAWDYRNRMSATGAAGATTTFAYDHNDQRVKKVSGGIISAYPNKLYAVSGGNVTKNIFAGGELVSTIEASSGPGPGADTGFKAPSATGSAFNEWTSPSDAYTSNDVRATVTGSDIRTGGLNEQDYSNFSLGVPSGATISGIEVKVEAQRLQANQDLAVRLSWNGGAAYTATTTKNINTASDSIYIFGGATSTWGRSWSSSDFSNANFRLYGTDATLTNRSVSIDQIMVKVYYAVSSPNGTTTQYVYGDHLGSTRFVTDDFGNIVQSIDYAPYGAESASTGANSTDRRYIGERYDEETDLSYLNARYYEGSRGQFLSEDPVFSEIGLTPDGKAAMLNPQLMNSYSYAGNNPITSKDPTGRCPNCLLALGGAGAMMLGQLGVDLYTGNWSSPQTYLVRGIQGAAVGFTGGLAGSALGLGVAGQAAVVGGASGVTGAIGSAYLGEPVTVQSVATDVAFGAATFGASSLVPRVPGRLPNFGTEAFFAGKHTQQSAMSMGVDAISSYLSSVLGNTSFGSGSSRSSYTQSQASSLMSIGQAFNPTNQSQAKALQSVIKAFSSNNKKQ